MGRSSNSQLYFFNLICCIIFFSFGSSKSALHVLQLNLRQILIESSLINKSVISYLSIKVLGFICMRLHICLYIGVPMYNICSSYFYRLQSSPLSSLSYSDISVPECIFEFLNYYDFSSSGSGNSIIAVAFLSYSMSILEFCLR